MQKTGRLALAAVGCGLALALGMLGGPAAAQLLPASDKPAAILVWPKIVVDTAAVLRSSAGSTDTLIQLSSTIPTRGSKPLDRPGMKQARCFYVNATGHCSNLPSRGCASSDDCTVGGSIGSCDPGWTEVDFDVRITPEQPLAWLASKGLRNFPMPVPGTCSNHPGISCSNDARCGGGTCILQPSNAGSGIPPVSEDPFIGSLTCIQFDPNGNPARPDTSSTANALIGNASIEVQAVAGAVDPQKYNAVGIRKLCTSANPPDCTIGGPVVDILSLGGPGNPAYQSCPSRLVLNHLFDGAPNPFGTAGTTSTDLTLVPCGNNFLTQEPGRITAQYLVFNEFEQRFSTSSLVDCFFEKEISNIDTPISQRSIFHYNVAGTLAGQTIIRGVGVAATGQGLLGVARVNIGPTNGAAYNLSQKGTQETKTDFIVIP